MSVRKLTLSVITPTYNCGIALRRCLKSVDWADQKIIVDMHSSDNTLEVAKKYDAKIILKDPPDGNFDKNRKLGMEVAKGDWILKLDSDEVLTREAQDDIRRILNASEVEIDGYYIRNKIIMFGKQIKYGFVKPNSSELRLVRKGKWVYNPYKFHQQIQVEGKTAIIFSYYLHYNFEKVFDFIQKTNKYTTLDSKFPPSKHSKLAILLSQILTFLKLFILQQGYKDGLMGFYVCWLYGFYSLIEKIKMYEFTTAN